MPKPKFTKKSSAQIAEMSDAEHDAYMAEKEAYQEALLDEAFKKVKEEVDEKLKTAATAEEQELLKSGLAELKETLDQFKESRGGGNGNGVSLKEELGEAFKDTVIAIKGGEKVRLKEFVIKATVLRSAVAGNPYFLDAGGIGQLAHRKLVLYDLFQKVPVPKNANGTVKYVDWDAATIVRAAAAVAEGAAFSESTAAWATYTLTLQKVGDSIPVSEEFMYDDEMFAAELENFLRTNVDIKVDTDLMTGNGTAPNIKGLLASISAYTPVASGIVDPNIYDLIVKVSEAITSPYGSKYAPNFALMNITDINKMKLKKDANNNYIIPPFATNGGQIVDGMTVIETNSLTANSMIIGDSRYAKIYEEPGIYVGVGYDADNWSKDLMTMKARRRMNLLVRTVDSTGFLKVTSISAALTTLAT